MNGRILEVGQTAIKTVAARPDAHTSLPGPMQYLHCAIFSARATDPILGDETFRLVSFEGQEGVSEPFEFELELHANTSDRHGAPLLFDTIVGRPVTVGIQCPSGYSREELALRFRSAVRGGAYGQELSMFNGVVSAFSMEIPGVYRLSMKPALWKLTLTNQYKIHRKLTIYEAIDGVLARHHVSRTMTAVSGDDNLALTRRQDWLQAGETDLEFIQRLMGKAHLSYYFTHTATGHSVVFVNQPSYVFPAALAGNRPLRYIGTQTGDQGMVQNDMLSRYSFQRALGPSSVRTVFTRQRAAWETDAVARSPSYTASSQPAPGDLPFNQYKIYQYGCSKAETTHFSDVTAQSIRTAASHFSGAGYCEHFRTGHQFTVTGHPAPHLHPATVRPELEGAGFVLTSVKHKASADGAYENEFQAIEAGGFLRAFSIQETTQGTVLARVVAGPAAQAGGDSTGAQNWRHFTPACFDPETSTLDDSGAQPARLDTMGVHVRFSTEPDDSKPVWVKLAPHMQTVPELGVTVTVARSQDESELPEIQSILHANGTMVIMPSRWTASTNVGSSYSTGYGDGQSIRFGLASRADLPAAATIVDGAYKTGNYRETSYAQGASYSFSLADRDAGQAADSAELFGAYGGVDDLLSASESFGSTFSRQRASVTSMVSQVTTSYAKSTVGTSINHSTITGTSHSDTTHGGDITSTTTINANSTTTSVQTGDVTSASTVTGTSSNTTAYNGTVTSVTTHNGDVDSTTSIEGTSTSHNTNTDVISVSTTRAQTSTSASVATNSNDAVGFSNRNSATGVSLDTSVVGSTTTMSMVGNSNSVSLVGPGFNYSNKGENPGVEEIALRLTMIEVMQIYL